jgi:WD40 repeat protein
MKAHLAFGATIAVCLGLSPLSSLAADVSGGRRPLTIPVSVANRPAGAVTCQVSLGPAVPVNALAMSPVGKTLAVGGYQEVLLWDLSGSKLIRRIAAGGYVGALAFLKDGKTLVVGEGDPCRSGAVRFLDVQTGNETFRSDDLKDVVRSLAVSPDGSFVAAGGGDSLRYVWNVAQRKLATTIQGHSNRLLHVSFSPNGKFLLTAGADNLAQIWNVGNWTSVARFTEAQPIHGAAFHPDGVQVLLAIGGPEISGLRFRKTDSPTFRRPISFGIAVPLGMVGPTKAGRMYVPCSDKTVKVIDVRTGGVLATLVGHQDWVYSAALSPDETLLAAGCADATVKLWNCQNNRLLATLVQLTPRTDEWLIVTNPGYVATSSPAALVWKAEKVSTPLNQLTAQLQSPEFVRKVIAGEKVKPPVLK